MANPVLYHEGSFPPVELDWSVLISLIGKANAAVARYDGLLTAIPNASFLLSPLTTQEAVMSSRIEGTQATMGEVLEYEAKGDNRAPESAKEADIWEILNYRNAMGVAEEMLRDLPLSQRVIKEAHRILLSGVRGHGKSPGEYRRIPNWIGPQGATIENARFIPIVADKLTEGMSRWEHYIHQEAKDRLIQLAILHVEFESLHPFLDGNGRLGRMLIPLFMHQKGLIHRPMFYISAFLEANRETYYDKLLAVSRDNDWTGWCSFFLEAIQTQAEENQYKVTAIIGLYDEMKKHFPEITHSQYAIHALDWIFKRPVFRSSTFIKHSKIPKPTAQRILNVLKENKILVTLEGSSGRRAATLAYRDLLNIAEGYQAF